jgi:protein gp37
MSENTKIEWTTHSWSPWRGCTKVSPGCANCYAETLSRRNPAVLGNWGKGKPRVLAKNWGDPVRWNLAAGKAFSDRVVASVFTPLDQPELAPAPYVRPTVFPSLCDWLDEEVPIEWLAQFLDLIGRTPNLTWLLLTKRPDNFAPRLQSAWRWMAAVPRFTSLAAMRVHEWVDEGKPPANVWVGTSVEDQIRADERIPALLDIPAVGRFISAEPLLGPVRLCDTGAIRIAKRDDPTGRCRDIDWVIVGGESGPGARPCNVDWIWSIVRDCRGASVPVFVKQLGARPVGRWTKSPQESGLGEGWPAGLKITHKKGGDPAEWPENLRVREFPPTIGGAR